MIKINRNPAGKLFNLLFGLSEIADGLIRVASLGYLHSRFALEVSKRAVKRHIAHQKKQRAALAAQQKREGEQQP